MSKFPPVTTGWSSLASGGVEPDSSGTGTIETTAEPAQRTSNVTLENTKQKKTSHSHAQESLYTSKEELKSLHQQFLTKHREIYDDENMHNGRARQLKKDRRGLEKRRNKLRITDYLTSEYLRALVNDDGEYDQNIIREFVKKVIEHRRLNFEEGGLEARASQLDTDRKHFEDRRGSFEIANLHLRCEYARALSERRRRDDDEPIVEEYLEPEEEELRVDAADSDMCERKELYQAAVSRAVEETSRPGDGEILGVGINFPARIGVFGQHLRAWSLIEVHRFSGMGGLRNYVEKVVRGPREDSPAETSGVGQNCFPETADENHSDIAPMDSISPSQ
ncbi:MAG: hypothetical protein M1833_002981 [Piccolia ochrophora]|nr:MAG: hypothetical protein M1833_002981 [Piccolia ochrophora]